jgi:hypothetical protein
MRRSIPENVEGLIHDLFNAMFLNLFRRTRKTLLIIFIELVGNQSGQLPNASQQHWSQINLFRIGSHSLETKGGLQCI